MSEASRLSGLNLSANYDSLLILQSCVVVVVVAGAVFLGAAVLGIIPQLLDPAMSTNMSLE